LEVDWCWRDYGGGGGVMSVRQAADAIECGHVDLAVLVGSNSFDRSNPTQRQLEYQRGNFVDVYGYGGPNSLMALIQRLHMEQYGTTLEQIGKIAIAQRENAVNNPQALFREPMSMQDYLNSRMISDPIQLFDCVMHLFRRRVRRPGLRRASRNRLPASRSISSPMRKFLTIR
jgi:acetyl-CoA acetyltransferase